MEAGNEGVILYADVIFLRNFLMDYLLLSMVKGILGMESRRGGIFFASGVGGFFALLAALPSVLFPGRFGSLLVGTASVFTAAFMVWAAFRLHSLRAGLRAMAGLYLAALLAAGIMEPLSRSLRFSAAWQFGMAACLSMGIGAFLWRWVSDVSCRNSHLYEVTIRFLGEIGEERSIQVTALLDTGNHLTEPFSGKPVCILWQGSCLEIWEEEQRLGRIWYLPFRSVGRQGGILPAIRAEWMEIHGKGESRRVEHPFLALSKEPLSTDDAYQMLLHEKIWLP